MQKASTRLLFDYWNALRGARSAPDRRDVDPTRIRTALANTFILERAPDEAFQFRLAGSHLCSAYCREVKGKSFSSFWHERDRDAVDTLVRAVTEDHAVALVTFQGITSVNTRTPFETILLPLRHNGATDLRILGAMSALDEPYWFGVQPILEQRVSGLRLIWPDELPATGDAQLDVSAEMLGSVAVNSSNGGMPMPATVFGQSARRYAHLAVINGGRS